MFDLRYHVASLAAVFLALVVGILVGVGLSSRGLDKAERLLLRQRITDLQSQLDSANRTATTLADRQRASDAFVQAAYPLVMRNRLKGRRIALVFVGAVDGSVAARITTALTDAGASPAVRLRALKVPISPAALDAALAARPALAAYVGPAHLHELGRALGKELVTGGDTPLWGALAGELVTERSGGGRRPVDGVVIVRSAKPQSGPTAVFLDGFYAGLRSAGVSAVGAETSNNPTSAMPVFDRLDISAVDDVDQPAGQLALAVMLAGGASGHYGLGAGAATVLPPVAPVGATTASGG